MFYIHAFGNPILVLNSAKATNDLLEQRGANYSSRPIRTMVIDLYVHYHSLPPVLIRKFCRIGWNWLFSSMPYGPRWKRHRALFHQYFVQRPNFISQVCNPVQEQEVYALLRSLSRAPENFFHSVKRSLPNRVSLFPSRLTLFHLEPEQQ